MSTKVVLSPGRMSGAVNWDGRVQRLVQCLVSLNSTISISWANQEPETFFFKAFSTWRCDWSPAWAGQHLEIPDTSILQLVEGCAVWIFSNLPFFEQELLGVFCISNIKRVVKKGSCVEPNLIFEAAPLPPRYDMIRRKTHLGCHLCPVENDPVPWEESIWSEAGNLSRRWGPWGPKFHPKNDNCYKIHQDTTIKMQKPLDINQRMIVDVCFALRELFFGNLS